MAQSLLKEIKTKKKKKEVLVPTDAPTPTVVTTETAETSDTQLVPDPKPAPPPLVLVALNPQSPPEDEEEDMPPPTTIIFEHIKEHIPIETPLPIPPDCFKSIMESFNNLPIDGKARILPYLLNWITKRDVKYFITVKRADSEYTEREATIIDRFNLLPEMRRRKMFPKIASYFSLQDIDYQIIQDDKWLSPYIQRVSK